MMQYIVDGGCKLKGECLVQGAKNSVLPMLSAALLCSEGEVTLVGCPDLSDVQAACDILVSLGCKVLRQEDTITVAADHVSGWRISRTLMQQMRSSVVFLGPILARQNVARICYPGGCLLGDRPIDIHLSAFHKMGATVTEEGDCVSCVCPEGLTGDHIYLPFPSVGATENVIMAASLAKGTTVLHNAAREPEIVDLCDLLCKMGAKIDGAGGGIITVEGVKKLHGTEKYVMRDRIAAATLMTATLATDGNVSLRGADPEHFRAVTNVLIAAGGNVTEYSDTITVRRSGAFILPVRSIRTLPYPAFPTDAQAIVMALLCRAAGTSVFVETIFPSRFKVVKEFCKMGAHISVEDNSAIVNGVPRLYGTTVHATDLRGGAALIIAALSAEGRSRILQAEHILRGYESIEKTLSLLGAKIYLEKEI